MSDMDIRIPPLPAPLIGSKVTLELRYPIDAVAEVETRGGSSITAGDAGGRSAYRHFGKRVLDIALVLAFLPIHLSLIGVAAAALYLEGGNPFYRQTRLGRNGRRFSIVKLRTMVRDAETRLQAVLARDPELRQEWEETQKLKHDPRVTRVGKLLRRSSLDELPQLWNVLTGDMSLVGPRPMMPEQLPLYGDPQHYFALRPGITGPWQIGRRNEGRFADRAGYDTDYDKGLSLWQDVKILLKTVGVVLRRTGH